METQTHIWLVVLAAMTIGAGLMQPQDAGDSTMITPAVPEDTTRLMSIPVKRGNDTFIDEDGDGICDGRAKGLGLRRAEVEGRRREDGAGQHRWRRRSK